MSGETTSRALVRFAERVGIAIEHRFARSFIVKKAKFFHTNFVGYFKCVIRNGLTVKHIRITSLKIEENSFFFYLINEVRP